MSPASTTFTRQSSAPHATTAAASTGRTAQDPSSDPALRPMQPSYRHCNRRPPALGVQPFLSLDPATAPVTSCMGGMYTAVAHQSRLLCLRIDTGDIGAIHNTPGPEERFLCVAPVQSGHDPAAECARVWACTTLGRVLALSTSSTAMHHEQLQSTSRASIVSMFAAGVGLVWTLRDDGLMEAWRDRSADGGHDQPLAPAHKFSIAIEMQLARKASSRRSLLMLYQRELWFAGSRTIWVFDTHRPSEQLASVSASALLSSQAAPAAGPMIVAHISVAAQDAGMTCLASNVPFLDEAQIGVRGFVFAGTEDGHVIAWRAATYDRWRTLDLGNGERDARVTAMACTSARWLWVGLATGRILVVDVGAESADDAPWMVCKAWRATDSAVASIHVDWTPLLTVRARLQVASVHANGSVYYWDGLLAMDWQYAELRRRTPSIARTRDVIVQINSWNIDAIKPEHLERTPEDRGFLRSWLGALGAHNEPDIIVVGLQEVVDLESKKMTAKSLWHNTTSKAKSKSRGGAGGADISKRYGLWRKALERALARGATFATSYRVVECQNMVGLFVCVFARDDVYRSVRDVDVAHVKTGMGGLHGNKGGIAVRLTLADTSLCFVNAHLAAGESASNNVARIAHCATITRGVSFRRPAAEHQAPATDRTRDPAADMSDAALDAFVDGGDGRVFLDHAACFFSGDLNFRLRVSRQQAERHLADGDLDGLLQHDQLLPMLATGAGAAVAGHGLPAAATAPAARLAPAAAPGPAQLRARSRSGSLSSLSSSDEEPDDSELEPAGAAGFALRNFHEMPIQFPPTYKYDPGTDRYDTSEKHRTPAWCDRVLFRGSLAPARARAQSPPEPRPALADHDPQGAITPLAYQRLECRQSDHRPIFAAFSVAVKDVDRDARARALADIRQQFAAQVAAEMTYLAKVMWLCRHTAGMGRAAALLAAAGGDLTDALRRHANPT